MLSCNLVSLQENIDRLITGYESIGLRVNALKTEFLEFTSSARKQLCSENTYVKVGRTKLFPGNSMKYLGITYGQDIRSSRLLIIDKISKSIRSSYGKLVSLKFSLNRKILAKLYAAVALPHLLYVSPLWDWFTQTDRLKLWSIYCKYLKFLLRYPLHERITFILHSKNMVDPTDIMPSSKRNTKKGQRKLCANSCPYTLFTSVNEEVVV